MFDISQIWNSITGKVDETVTETFYKEDCEGEIAVDNFFDDYGWIAKGGLGIGGAVLGSSIGSNFGTIGKLGLGLVGAFAAPKLIGLLEETATDVASASDYCQKEEKETGKKLSFGDKWSRTWANFQNLDGQDYTGKTSVVADPDPDM